MKPATLTDTKTAVLTVVSPKYGTFRVLIDSEDLPCVIQHRWHVWNRRNRTYFRADIYKPDGRRTQIYLHRLIMPAPGGMDVDHIHHDYLDCRKSQLRICTRSQNSCNQRKCGGKSSQYKGVSLNRTKKRLKSSITINRKVKNLGYFPITAQGELDAARAYDRAAIEIHGSFASLNFPAAAA